MNLIKNSKLLIVLLSVLLVVILSAGDEFTIGVVSLCMTLAFAKVLIVRFYRNINLNSKSN